MQADHSTRMPFIDALKAICCLLIVAHHLAIYGPMSDFAYPLMPGLLDWLREDGRIAVQMFFVITGFLVAKKLAPQSLALDKNPIELIHRRYVRLITPYLAALTLAIAAAALARIWMQHESVPGAPNLLQLLAHIFLLHDLLNQEALSAGVWYVAIDFQLFALTILVLWTAHRIQNRYAGLKMLNIILICSLTIASLFFFNRDRYWDETALYFFGAYGLGILTYWTSISARQVLWFTVLMALIFAALMIDFRSRIAVAGSVALLLGLAHYFNALQSRHIPGYLTYLGRASYSIFLIHFPVLLIINTVFFRFLPHQPEIQLCGLLLAMCASIGSGILLFNWLEARPVTKRVHILLPAGFMTCGLLVMLGSS